MGCLDRKSFNYLGTVTGNQLLQFPSVYEDWSFLTISFFLDFKFSSTEFSVFQFLENKKLEIGEQLKGKWRGPLLVRAALNLIYQVFSFLVFQFFQFYLNDK